MSTAGPTREWKALLRYFSEPPKKFFIQFKAAGSSMY